MSILCTQQLDRPVLSRNCLDICAACDDSVRLYQGVVISWNGLLLCRYNRNVANTRAKSSNFNHASLWPKLKGDNTGKCSISQEATQLFLHIICSAIPRHWHRNFVPDSFGQAPVFPLIFRTSCPGMSCYSQHWQWTMAKARSVSMEGNFSWEGFLAVAECQGV